MSMTQTKKKIRQTKTYKISMIIFLACLCVVSTTICVAVGSVKYTVKEVVEAFLDTEANARLIVWNVRFPRVLAGGMVGICLSLAGCILQGVMRNHLASPSTIGVTSGASFVGYMTLVAFPKLYDLLPIGAILGSFATTMLIYVLAYDRGVSPVKMILSGMAVSAVFSAFNDIIKVFFSERLADATGYLVGSLNGVSWADLKMILPYAAVGIFICAFLPAKMNILMLGDEMANTLGLRTEQFRLILIMIA